MINIDIYLDGKKLIHTKDFLLEQPLRLVYSKSEKVERLEGSITFINDAYELIIDKLVYNPQYAATGLIQGIPIRLVDLCDDKVFFEGEIRADTLDFCDKECYVTATPINASPQKRFLDYFEATYISEPESIRTQINHPKVVFALVAGGNAVGYLIAWLLGIVIFFLKKIDIIVDILRTIINILSLGALRRRLRNFDLSPVIQAISDLGTGLAYFHPTPYLRTYITETIHLCNQRAGTNFTFKSSIFEPNSPYYNTVYFFSDYDRGRDIDFNNLSDTGLITNEPLKTGADLLNDLKTVFNADWRIIGNQVVFERVDFFENKGVNLQQYKTCYTLRDTPLPAAIEIKFADDASNSEANTNGYYDYFELWNKDPFSPRQKGIEKINIPFGRTRQLYDKNVDFSFTGKQLNFQQYAIAQKAFQILFSATDPKLSHLKRTKAPLLVMDNGRVTNPILLVINPQQDAFWGNLIVNNNIDYYGKTLYERFYQIKNPRGEYMRKRKPLNFNIENLPIQTYNIYDKVQLSRGLGIVTDIEIEYYPDRKVALRGEM
ncbi:MAG: hypothetical protein NZ519_05120 [Bacteroidia bacterium]|nr:hypothetical protein [Bacteroidia bacterium]